jgi:tripartite-type tricarboxylate transporter receptor subunit TctC
MKALKYLAAGWMLCAAAAAWSQAYPAKPIRMVTPFTTGGATGLLGRAIGEKLTSEWGQAVIVEGKPSAGGIVATQTVASSPPDGYTILLATANVSIAPSLYKSLPYDPETALVPVTEIITVPNVIVARPNLQAKTMADVVALARAQPGKLNYASPGSGSFPHLIMEQFKHDTGADILHIPYKGTPAALVALVAGEVDLFSSNLADVSALIKAGKVRAIAVTSPERFPTLPDVPTVAESGVPGFNAVGWMGFFAPQKTPAAVVDKLGKQIAAIVTAPEMRSWLREQGFEAVGSTPAQFATFLKADMARWAEVVRYSGLKPE